MGNNGPGITKRSVSGILNIWVQPSTAHAAYGFRKRIEEEIEDGNVM
jgi:hypothetical protein